MWHQVFGTMIIESVSFRIRFENHNHVKTTQIPTTHRVSALSIRICVDVAVTATDQIQMKNDTIVIQCRM